jgi:hypothetical protein
MQDNYYETDSVSREIVVACIFQLLLIIVKVTGLLPEDATWQHVL